MFVLAGFQVFCARVANTLLTSWSPLTYERGDALQAFEEENEVHEPCPSCDGEMDFVPPYDRPRRQRPPDHAAGVEAPTPPAAFKLPMFNAKDLEAIAGRYLVEHFPWPEDGLFACTCGTKGFTIAAWSAHVAELQISETVFELQSLVYDQTQQK